MYRRVDRILHLAVDNTTGMVFRSREGRWPWPMVVAALVCAFIAYTYGPELRPRPRLLSLLLYGSAVLLFHAGLYRLLSFRELRLDAATGALLFTTETPYSARTMRFTREQITSMELWPAPTTMAADRSSRYVVIIGTHGGETFLLADTPLGIHGQERAREMGARLERLLLCPLVASWTVHES